MADATHIPQEVENFITHWSKAEASERANAQAFLIGLTKILGVPEPSHTHADGYTFEFPVKIPTGPGTSTDGRLDLYRRGCFVLEAKQFVAPRSALNSNHSGVERRSQLDSLQPEELLFSKC